MKRRLIEEALTRFIRIDQNIKINFIIYYNYI